MAYSRNCSFSKRCIALIMICGILVGATLFACRPSDYAQGIVRYAREHITSHDSRHLPLTWNNSCLLANCERDEYTMRGLTTRSNRLRNGRRSGYVLCLNYREQQTRAASSMYSLQCWAKTLLVNLVEPFLHDSRLVVPLDPTQKTMLAFGDLFNLRQWDILTTKLGFAPLVPWRQFLSRAPRDLILVHLQYKIPSSSNKTSTTIDSSSDFTEGCTDKSQVYEQMDYLTQYGFHIVRRVCINFELGIHISLEQFNRHILGPYQPNDVSIVINEWRGFSTSVNGKRALVNDACQNTMKSSLYLQPSPRIYCDAHNYQTMYLGGGNDYISVIVRTEKARQMVGSESEMKSCLKRTVELLSHVQNRTNLNSTFLSMDIGKYGSYSSASNFNTYNYTEFITDIYGRHASVAMWEESFERITSSHEAGYIALLQKVLVADAQCMIMVGGGSFQKHAILLHKIATKRRGRAPCIHILKSCSKNMNIDLTK